MTPGVDSSLFIYASLLYVAYIISTRIVTLRDKAPRNNKADQDSDVIVEQTRQSAAINAAGLVKYKLSSGLCCHGPTYASQSDINL